MDETIEQEVSAKGKSRHWFLTTWLILMILGNIGGALTYILLPDAFANLPGWIIPVNIVVSLVNLGSIIVIFMWKRWGFWVLCGTATAVFILNIVIGVGVRTSLLGLVGVPLLFGVLHIGKEKKGWTQLT
jgi:hypothetical protein